MGGGWVGRLSVLLLLGFVAGVSGDAGRCCFFSLQAFLAVGPGNGQTFMGVPWSKEI